MIGFNCHCAAGMREITRIEERYLPTPIALINRRGIVKKSAVFHPELLRMSKLPLAYGRPIKTRP